MDNQEEIKNFSKTLITVLDSRWTKEEQEQIYQEMKAINDRKEPSWVIGDLINNAKHGESGVLYKDSSIQRELKANISEYRQELAHLGIDVLESKKLPMVGVSFAETYERVLCTHLGWEDRL